MLCIESDGKFTPRALRRRHDLWCSASEVPDASVRQLCFTRRARGGPPRPVHRHLAGSGARPVGDAGGGSKRASSFVPSVPRKSRPRALVCRFCGFRFDSHRNQAGAPPPPREPLAQARHNAAASRTSPAVPVGQITGPNLAWFAGAVLMALGSIGPWATSPFSSVSGTSGDGVITLVAAAVLAVLAVGPTGFPSSPS